ncbi:peptidoglycan-binding domain-containing protein [Tissierella praeacuta]|nr:peptidoglycan-binding protein [Tissierella praeacuta]
MGNKTTAAIKKFQKDKGLTVDGIAGAKTKEALGI